MVLRKLERRKVRLHLGLRLPKPETLQRCQLMRLHSRVSSLPVLCHLRLPALATRVNRSGSCEILWNAMSPRGSTLAFHASAAHCHGR